MTVEDAASDSLAQRAASRDLDWNAVYADQLPRLYNFFRFRTGREADAEDLTAQTFEKAWKARAQYRSDLGGFSTWLFSIARNVATDALRTRRMYASLDAARDLASGTTPEDDVAQRSDIARLARLTQDLPDRQRELLALKYGAALNNRMIARITGLSESNVGTTLQRTVEKLRAQWDLPEHER
jgi:RNA polymerase sigma-70 factor (ECF subfamily)